VVTVITSQCRRSDRVPRSWLIGRNGPDASVIAGVGSPKIARVLAVRVEAWTFKGDIFFVLSTEN